MKDVKEELDEEFQKQLERFSRYRLMSYDDLVREIEYYGSIEDTDELEYIMEEITLNPLLNDKQRDELITWIERIIRQGRVV